MREEYIKQGEGFLIVYSVTSRDSFLAMGEFFELVQKVKNLSSFPAVLVGNKCDLVNERKVTFNEGKAFADKWGVPFVESSGMSFF